MDEPGPTDVLSFPMDELRPGTAEDPTAPMPPPTDVMPRYDYPRPWLGGKWTP